MLLDWVETRLWNLPPKITRNQLVIKRIKYGTSHNSEMGLPQDDNGSSSQGFVGEREREIEFENGKKKGGV